MYVLYCGPAYPKVLLSRNLCAHRWLIPLKGTSGGSKEEFDKYYKSLSDEQRKVSARILDYLFYIP